MRVGVKRDAYESGITYIRKRKEKKMDGRY